MHVRRITKNFFLTLANSIERALFVRVWTQRDPATGKYEAKDVEYARSKYKPIFASGRQVADFFLFLLLIVACLFVVYLLVWLFFSTF